MNTAVIMVPAIFPEEYRPNFPEDLEPEKAKARVDELLADGYRITIMNDYE